MRGLTRSSLNSSGRLRAKLRGRSSAAPRHALSIGQTMSERGARGKPRPESGGVEPAVCAAEDEDAARTSVARRAQLPEFLVAEQVKAILRIGDRALHDWDRRGWLTPIKVGRRKLYSKDEVLQVFIKGTLKKARNIKDRID